MDYIGISEDRLHHILGVARKCYRIAKEREFDEDFCRKMFLLGIIHDLGYEYAEEQDQHPYASEELLKTLIKDNSKDSLKALHAIRTHGRDTKTKTQEWIILNIADMTTDSKGNDVTVEQRLEDIKNRYGADSKQYMTAYELAGKIGLLKT